MLLQYQRRISVQSKESFSIIEVFQKVAMRLYVRSRMKIIDRRNGQKTQITLIKYRNNLHNQGNLWLKSHAELLSSAKPNRGNSKKYSLLPAPKRFLVFVTFNSSFKRSTHSSFFILHSSFKHLPAILNVYASLWCSGKPTTSEVEN